METSRQETIEKAVAKAANQHRGQVERVWLDLLTFPLPLPEGNDMPLTSGLLHQIEPPRLVTDCCHADHYQAAGEGSAPIDFCQACRQVAHLISEAKFSRS